MLEDELLKFEGSMCISNTSPFLLLASFEFNTFLASDR